MEEISQYILICYIAIAIGIGCLLYALLANAFRKFFLTKGEKVEGIVFDVEPIARTGFDNTYDKFRHNEKVTIRFTTKKQEWITADLDSTIAKWFTRYRGQYKQGDKVLVIYQPDNPYDFHIVPAKTSATEQTVFAIAGLAFIGVGIYFLLTPP